MIGLFGYNMFNQNNNTGRELWAMTLRQGGGNPGMKVNPIYVKDNEEKPEDVEVLVTDEAENITKNEETAEEEPEIKSETEVTEIKSEVEETENKSESEKTPNEDSMEKKED